ncbi:DUF808 domain-containing protein [Acinetobacter sp. c2-A9]|uniref:DUF808 domain-containing protein n=1 Tax=Acinetobacter sp. c2-A9 TaxID=3342802 RepID=UPI0035B90E9D
MASGLLVLLDDIATIMDDVALMSKMAVKKTSGVLGDDLALNAQQLTGVRSDRELPIVWRVAKGSFVNKMILVPAALLISWAMPSLINPLLVIGGLFLCYEGVEKILHTLLHKPEVSEEQGIDVHPEIAGVQHAAIDLEQFENEKVKGAVRTDFILSAEIVVITLGTISVSAPFVTKLSVLSIIAVIMTIGVYGFVAMIVKIDDLGLYLLEKENQAQQKIGQALLAFAPILMKTLSVVGTAAMFLVGGGIISHAVPYFHHLSEDAGDYASGLPAIGAILGGITPTLINFAIGIIAGLIVVGVVMLGQKIFKKAA